MKKKYSGSSSNREFNVPLLSRYATINDMFDIMSYVTVPMQAPYAANVCDDSITLFRTFIVPKSMGTYTYDWLWQNGKGANMTYKITDIVYSPTQAKVFLGSDTQGDCQVYDGDLLEGINFFSTLPLVSGVIGTYTDEYMKQNIIGTWTIDENLNGAPAQVAKFDLQMLAVENVKAAPSSFDPSLPDGDPNKSTKITADIVALPASTELFPDGWVPEGSIRYLAVACNTTEGWVGKIKESVITNVPNPNGTGKVATIELPWSGTLQGWEPGEAEGQASPGNYRIDIKALANLKYGGTAITWYASGDVTIGQADPVLEVYETSDDGATGDLLASSEDKIADLPQIVYLPVYPDGTSVSMNTSMKNNVKANFEMDADLREMTRISEVINKYYYDTMKLAVVLRDYSTFSDKLTVNITLGKDLPVTVYLDRESLHKYKGILTIGPVGANSDIQMPKRDWSFSSYDATSFPILTPLTGTYADTLVFVNNEKARGMVELGSCFNYKDSGDIISAERLKYFPKTLRSGFRAAGYETMKFSYNNDRKCLTLKIKNQAKEFYYSGHGSHKNGAVWENRDIWIAPKDDLTYNDWRESLDTVILACCSVLDIGDFNNHYTGEDHQINPGLLWDNKVERKFTDKDICLLGYNKTAPSSPYDEDIISDYFQKIKSMRNPIQGERVEPFAWLRANALITDYDTGCAITKKYYYFISYVSTPVPGKKERWAHYKRTIYAIKKQALVQGTIPEFSDLKGTKHVVKLSNTLPKVESPIK
jgi:hypothetical protein